MTQEFHLLSGLPLCCQDDDDERTEETIPIDEKGDACVNSEGAALVRSVRTLMLV
jgi:hypothetical protein